MVTIRNTTKTTHLQLTLLLRPLLQVVIQTAAPDFRVPASFDSAVAARWVPEYYTSANTATSYRQVLCDPLSPSDPARQAIKPALLPESKTEN